MMSGDTIPYEIIGEINDRQGRGIIFRQQRQLATLQIVL